MERLPNFQFNDLIPGLRLRLRLDENRVLTLAEPARQRTGSELEYTVVRTGPHRGIDWFGGGKPVTREVPQDVLQQGVIASGLDLMTLLVQLLKEPALQPGATE